MSVKKSYIQRRLLRHPLGGYFPEGCLHTLFNRVEMVINMRKYLCNILIALFLFTALPSMRVLAAGRDGFRLDDGGTVTVVSQHAAKEEVSSLGFSLLVESDNADKVEFQFEESNAEILEFRYDENAKKLNIYVAGTEALFAEGTDSLTIGRIIVQDENGGEASAKVSVVEDSLQYVYGAELKTMQELDLPEAVQLGPVRGDSPNDNDDDDEAYDDYDNYDVPAAPAVTPAPTASPVRTPRPTARPVATTAPTRSPSVGDSLQASNSTPKPSPSSSPESTATPAVEESVPSSTPSPSGGNTDQSSNENKESKGIDIVFVIAIAAIVIFVIVAVIAFVVLKKLPKKPKE